MNAKIQDFIIGDLNFKVSSIGNARQIEITDAYCDPRYEKIGFRKKLILPFTDSTFIDDKKYKQENEFNIESLKKLCEFILNEINTKQI